MLRSNSKKAKENIRQYIRDGFTGENYGIEEPQKFEDLAQLLEETPEEAAKYSEQDAERTLTYLIFRELSAAERKAKTA